MGDSDSINALIKTLKDGGKKWKDIRAEVNITFELMLTEDAVRKRYAVYVKKLAKTASAPAPVSAASSSAKDHEEVQLAKTAPPHAPASAPGPGPASAPAVATEAATMSATPLLIHQTTSPVQENLIPAPASAPPSSAKGHEEVQLAKTTPAHATASAPGPGPASAPAVATEAATMPASPLLMHQNISPVKE
jgi:hypothetical protein